MFECLRTMIFAGELTGRDSFPAERALVESSRFIKEHLDGSYRLYTGES